MRRFCIQCGKELLKRPSEAAFYFRKRVTCGLKCSNSRREVDITGKVFNRLTAVIIHPTKKRYWIFRCKCGTEKEIKKSSVVQGITKSCGCQLRESASINAVKTKTTHGLSKTRIYDIYNGMKTRCNNTNSSGYFKYGAKGIKVEWKSFEDFSRDMLESYAVHSAENGENNTTIDRIDPRGNYSVGNCRWATHKVQASNKAKACMISK